MSSEQCALIREASSNISYHMLISTKLLLCCAGVCGIIYQWCKQGGRFLVHDNSKVEFHFHYALNVYSGTNYILAYLIELIRLRFDCCMLDFRIVLMTKASANCAIFSAHHIIVLLLIERLYSSIFPAHFEKTSSKRLAFGLTIFEVDINTNNAVSSILSCYSSYYFIRKPAVIDSSLAISYQRSENRRVILTLLPIEMEEGTIVLFVVVTQILLFGAFSPIGRMIFTELTHYTMLNSLVIAIVIELRVARRNRKIVTTVTVNFDHFEQLRRAWN
ncbi:hypothetical protein PRIPAC_81900 [Pristionchus pacificus]|uniref:Uncharacterized protein n=1 Tax=Pristionchus pacificus TaxID=54126 RepID=A0A2A6CMU2_PRIPA|nr:hypothetical protein PRIPAC_81900 [Pristionchus pacificus]|eukprot:PDM79407.1 hypothetical protein PRIPAC_31986 [Pristionchus pacificus]